MVWMEQECGRLMLYLGEINNPNETVNISLTQVGGSSADLIGASITITDDDSGDTLLTATWNGNTITTEIPMGTYYTVSVETIVGYLDCADRSYLAGYQTTRNIGFQYTAPGVYIESISHQLYTSSEWSSSYSANAIVVITSDVQLRLAVNSQQKYQLAPQQYSDMTSYCRAVGSTDPIVTYDGDVRTTEINNWLSAHGITSGNYASIYCSNYIFPDNTTHGHLLSWGELRVLCNNKTQIDACITACNGIPMIHETDMYAAAYMTSLLSTAHNGTFFRYSWVNNTEGNNLSLVHESNYVRPVAYYTL